MDILHGAMRLDRRISAGSVSSSPHTAPLQFHQIESSYDRNEERRVDSDTRGGGRRQNCEGDDGCDSVVRNFHGRRWSGPGGEGVSSTPDADGAVGGEQIPRCKRKHGSTTGAGARQEKGEMFGDAEVGNAAISNPSKEVVPSSSNKKKRVSSECGQSCATNTTSLSAADDTDGTADVEGEGSITPNNGGEDSAAAAGYNSSSVSTSDDDGNSTGCRRLPLDDGGDRPSTDGQFVRAAINDNKKFEERDREFEEIYDGSGHNEHDYLIFMLSKLSPEEKMRYYCLRNEAVFGMNFFADDDATDDTDEEGGSSFQGKKCHPIDFESGGGDIVESDGRMDGRPPSAVASSFNALLPTLLPAIAAYLPCEEVDTALPLVSKNFKDIVYEHYPRSEFYSCDHCPRKFRTRAQHTAHDEACRITVGRAEDDDDAYFPPANDVFEMEKKVDSFSCQTVGRGAKDISPETVSTALDDTIISSSKSTQKGLAEETVQPIGSAIIATNSLPEISAKRVGRAKRAPKAPAKENQAAAKQIHRRRSSRHTKKTGSDAIKIQPPASQARQKAAGASKGPWTEDEDRKVIELVDPAARAAYFREQRQQPPQATYRPPPPQSSSRPASSSSSSNRPPSQPRSRSKSTPSNSSQTSSSHHPTTGQIENTGRWTAEEHRLFLRGLEQHGKGWKKIATLIKSRTVVQIRTHAQKYFQKLAKARDNGEMLPDGVGAGVVAMAHPGGVPGDHVVGGHHGLKVGTRTGATPMGMSITPAIIGSATPGNAAKSVVGTSSNGWPTLFQVEDDNGVLTSSRSAAIGTGKIGNRMNDSMRPIVYEFGMSMLDVMIKNNEFADQDSSLYAEAPRDYQMDSNRSVSVYGEFEKKDVDGIIEWILKKIGCASDLLDRSCDYSTIIRCLMSLDQVDSTVEKLLHDIFDLMIEKILEPNSGVEEPMKRFIRAMRESGAFSFGGIGRAMIVQLLESAATKKHNESGNGAKLGVLNEWAHYPIEMLRELLQEKKTLLEALLSHPGLCDLLCPTEECELEQLAMLDWAAGHNGLSSHIVFTEVAGFKFVGNALPALYPGGKGVEKIYCTKYNKQQLEEGRFEFKKFIRLLMDRARNGKRVFGLLNFYCKLYTWPQLYKLILSIHEDEDLKSGFVEVANVFHNPSISDSKCPNLPSELVIFRMGTVLFAVNKSWSSAADSSGRITTEMALQCAQTIDLAQDLANAFRGKKVEPSFVALEACMANLLLRDNFHRYGPVCTAMAREMATPKEINAIELSKLRSRHHVYFLAARGNGQCRGRACSGNEWKALCAMTAGETEQEGLANIVAFCGDDRERTIAIMNYFRGSEKILSELRNKCQGAFGVNLPSLEEYHARVKCEERMYEEKRENFLKLKAMTPEEKKQYKEAEKEKAAKKKAMASEEKKFVLDKAPSDMSDVELKLALPKVVDKDDFYALLEEIRLRTAEVTNSAIAHPATSSNEQAEREKTNAFYEEKRQEAEATAATAASAEEREDAVRLFDTSAEGKERRSLTDKLKYSKLTMTERDVAELASLDAQRSMLTLARDEAKRKIPKNCEDITVATKAVKDWDNSNKSRRKYLKQKKGGYSQLTMTEEELALLDELNTRRASLSKMTKQELASWMASCKAE